MSDSVTRRSLGIWHDGGRGYAHGATRSKATGIKQVVPFSSGTAPPRSTVPANACD